MEGLTEVETLLSLAKQSEKDSRKYSIFNRTSLLLLVSKFECFLENLIEEYVYNIENLNVSADVLPESMKLHITNHAFNDDFIVKLRKSKTSVIKAITEIIPIWNMDSTISSLAINKKFDYGKHGAKAIQKLFHRIGVEDIFSLCPVYETKENLNKKDKIRVEVDIKVEINSITNFRNIILHEDTPTSLTHNQIEIYRDRLVLFAGSLSLLLKKNKDSIAKKMTLKKK